MAATDLVVLDNTITYEGSGFPTLDALIIKTINRDDLMEEYKQYTSLMDYTDTTLLNPFQTFSAKSAPKGLQNINETGIKPRVDFAFTPKKWIYQQEIAGEFSSSYLFTQWARNAQTIKGASDSIQAELADVASQTRDLVLAYDIRYAEEEVKLWANWFSVTAANGPGSATPKGNPLFYAYQPYGVPGTPITGTFSNIVTGAVYTDIATGTAQLQNALNLIKQTKDENGKFIAEPKNWYKLYTSKVRAVFWKQVLNDNSQYSGQGTNANQMNQFNFKGNIVELVILNLLGQPDSLTWANIGSADNAFLTNPDYLKKAQAFRTYRLYNPRVKSFENMETDELQTSIRAIVGVDHYGAELGIVGIQWS